MYSPIVLPFFSPVSDRMQNIWSVVEWLCRNPHWWYSVISRSLLSCITPLLCSYFNSYKLLLIYFFQKSGSFVFNTITCTLVIFTVWVQLLCGMSCVLHYVSMHLFCIMSVFCIFIHICVLYIQNCGSLLL
jgi:hypothetical protein